MLLDDIDLMVRGGAAALNVYIAARWIGARRNSLVTLFGALFSIGVAIFILTVHTDVFIDTPLTLLPVFLMGKLTAFWFWLFAQALFDDGFRLRPLHAVPGVAILVVEVLPVGPAYLFHQASAMHLVTVSLFSHSLWLALRGWRAELVDKRLTCRMGIAVVVPVTGIGIIALEVAAQDYQLTGVLLVIQTTWVFLASALFAFWLSRLDETILPPEANAPRPRPAEMPPADRIELARLQRAIEEGRLFEPGLSIGTLADIVGVPEHRLRRLINRGLGYRNFNAFLNDHRVEEAQRRLADPGLAREQIIQHAFALGYASLAPFNRAFRERTGQSPSAYRAEALERVLAE